jgi:hypothetical protein
MQIKEEIDGTHNNNPWLAGSLVITANQYCDGALRFCNLSRYPANSSIKHNDGPGSCRDSFPYRESAMAIRLADMLIVSEHPPPARLLRALAVIADRLHPPLNAGGGHQARYRCCYSSPNFSY